MLVNLDNRVHFENVFTNVEVFTAFVKDVLDIELQIEKVETEKVLLHTVHPIKFKMDLFAEDKYNRTVVEIQKVDYDYTYERFTHYFLANLIDVQRKSKDYSFAKDVYIIVIITSAYKVSDKTGKIVTNDILITDINPRDWKGQIVEMNNHKMVLLNTACVQVDTPQPILDWMNLIIESIDNPENPVINTTKPAIARAAVLADIDEVTPEQLAEGKIEEMRRKAAAYIENQTETRVRAEMTAEFEEKEAQLKAEAEQKETDMIVAMAATGLPIAQIAQITKKTIAEIEAIIGK